MDGWSPFVTGAYALALVGGVHKTVAARRLPNTAAADAYITICALVVGALCRFPVRAIGLRGASVALA